MSRSFIRISQSKVQVEEWIFDFENMICYPCANLRKRHINFSRYGFALTQGIHLAYHELKFIKGNISVWWAGEKHWAPPWGFEQSAKPQHDQLNKAYLDYITEQQLLLK